MIVVFELLDEGVISPQAINDKDSVIGLVNCLMGGLTDIVGKMFRGDLSSAMSHAKKHYKNPRSSQNTFSTG